jgi:hypothetical protein
MTNKKVISSREGVRTVSEWKNEILVRQAAEKQHGNVPEGRTRLDRATKMEGNRLAD